MCVYVRALVCVYYSAPHLTCGEHMHQYIDSTHTHPHTHRHTHTYTHTHAHTAYITHVLSKPRSNQYVLRACPSLCSPRSLDLLWVHIQGAYMLILLSNKTPYLCIILYSMSFISIVL